MPIRQEVGRENVLRACNNCHPELTAAGEALRKREFAENVQGLCEIIIDKCIKYRNGNIDDYGLDESLRVFKDAIGDLLQGVKG